MKKLLFIRYRKVKNILEGGEQCSQKNFNVLSELLGKENITTYYIHDDNIKKTIFDKLSGIYWMLRNYFFGINVKKVKEIIQLASDFDYVFIDRSIFGIIAKKLRRTNYKGQIITFFHNVEKIYFASKIKKWLPWRSFVLKCADVNDRYSCLYSDKIIALNKRDEQELLNRYQRKADVLIPIAFKDIYYQKNDQGQMTHNTPKCLFVGAYFPSNNEGIFWFIKHVFPQVNIHLTIVGKWMSQFKKKYPVPATVEVLSDVPDLKPYIENADIVILPIFSGSGMKVKTCESLMYGKNILATSEAFEGYDLDYDKVGGLCNTKEEFIGKITDFIENPRPVFNQYARQQFLENYSEEAVVGKFEKILFE